VPDFIWNIAAFIVAISILVCFHEFGHYWVARRVGVKVLRFSLGWGKPWKTFRSKDGVEWVLAPWPIGGYVKMLDEREGPVAAHEKHLAFNNQSVPKRMAILVAGPLANFILAFFVYWLVLVCGISDALKPEVGTPLAGSAAERAGLRAGDLVVQIGERRIATFEALQNELLDAALDRRELALTVRDSAGAERLLSLDLQGVRFDPDLLFGDLGLVPNRPLTPPVIASVLAGKPAEAAGFQAGDRLLTRDGEAVASWEDWQRWVRANPGVAVVIGFERNGETLQRSLTLGDDLQQGRRVGLFGAGATGAPLPESMRVAYRVGPLDAIPEAAHRTWQTTALILKSLRGMVTGEISLKNVSGPIQIAEVTGYAAQVGLLYFLGILAGISISLGVLNLLPVPLLDGGHLLMYAIEGIKGKPLSERVQIAGQYVGIAFIGMLMVLAFYNDIMRQF